MKVNGSTKRCLLATVDVIVIAVAAVGAYLLRFDQSIPHAYLPFLPWTILLAELAFLPPFLVFGLYSRAWRYASIDDMLALGEAVLAGTLLFLGMRVGLRAVAELVPGDAPWILRAVSFPRSIPVITGFIVGLLVGVTRFGIRVRESASHRQRMVGRMAEANARAQATARRYGHSAGRGEGVAKARPDDDDNKAEAGVNIDTHADDDADDDAEADGHIASGSDDQAYAVRPTPGPKLAGHNHVLIVGAGEAGVASLREIRNATPWRVVGFIDDDPAKQGLRLQGVPVLGDRNDIGRVARAYHVETILIAMPTAPRAAIREIHELARKTGCRVQIVPGLYELMNGRVTVNRIREVRIEDLLGREPVKTDLHGIQACVGGRTVLVTGAGGSIGSELCRQVARFGVARLVLLGHGENSIFAIQNELRETYPDLKLVPCIADMRDVRKVNAIFGQYRPQVVFHAAAHKHVPLMEANPDEAVTNNVFGTLNLARAADRVGAERFVMISTDKAVNPTNAMGASKRVAEMIVQTLNRYSRTRFVAVRFGNVLGSRGSVVPTFKRQIAAGGPVTVTHPDMRRYFMTIPEAVQLVLQAAALAEGGEIYLLNMGEPVRIVDLAREMIRLSGFEPDVDIKIKFTGIRPGEKLFEELRTDDESVERTAHGSILKLRGQEVDEHWLEHGLQLLRTVVTGDPFGAMVVNGVADSAADGVTDGAVGGVVGGVADGVVDGVVDGAADGVADGGGEETALGQGETPGQGLTLGRRGSLGRGETPGENETLGRGESPGRGGQSETPAEDGWGERGGDGDGADDGQMLVAAAAKATGGGVDSGVDTGNSGDAGVSTAGSVDTAGPAGLNEAVAGLAQVAAGRDEVADGLNTATRQGPAGDTDVRDRAATDTTTAARPQGRNGIATGVGGMDWVAGGTDGAPAKVGLGYGLSLAERAARAKALLIALGQRQPAQILDRLALGLGPADSVTQAQVHAQPHTQVQSQLDTLPHTQVQSQLHTQVQTQNPAQAAPSDGVQNEAEGRLKPSLGG